MNNNFNTKTIDPQKANLPDKAIIQRVHSEIERLPNSEHDKAVKAFYFSDSIASGIGKDLAFVDKIPQLINEIIENKSWECLYVSKGVTTPYYCRYVKGTESENFRAFITAKRPNGLETSVETLDRVLQANSEVQRKLRAIIYESRQGERTDLNDETSGLEVPKLELGDRQQKRIRAAERAAEAIPEISELLDTGLIAIDIAAKLGHELKDPDNLTAEEREYVDKRDLIGIRIRQYIYTNPIPEDEDKEPAYSRELNSFVKDLLGIKDRSKSIRMDHPKKAAEKLLKFYDGEKLKELIDLLRQGLEQLPEQPETINYKDDNKSSEKKDITQTSPEAKSQNFLEDNRKQMGQNTDIQNEYKAVSTKHTSEYTTSSESTNTDSSIFTSSAKQEDLQNYNSQEILPATGSEAKSDTDNNVSNIVSPQMQLTLSELAERLGKNPQTVKNMTYKQKKRFVKWSQKLDPNGIAWQRQTGERKRKGEPLLFIPVTETNLEETNQQENSNVVENGI